MAAADTSKEKPGTYETLYVLGQFLVASSDAAKTLLDQVAGETQLARTVRVIPTSLRDRVRFIFDDDAGMDRLRREPAFCAKVAAGYIASLRAAAETIEERVIEQRTSGTYLAPSVAGLRSVGQTYGLMADMIQATMEPDNPSAQDDPAQI